MGFDLKKHYDLLYRYCYLHLCDRETAQDMVQESFIRYMERYGPLEEKAVPYLYVIARNLCIDHYRRQRIRSKHEELNYVESLSKSEDLLRWEVQDQSREVLERIIIKKALSGLSFEEKEILLLVIVNELSMKEVSVILGISRFSVYRRLQKAKKRFREKLEQEGVNGDEW